MDKDLKTVVVIFGSEGSGNSMLTNILLDLGMSVTNDDLGSSEQNPEGFFEDTEIVEIHKNLMDDLGVHPMLVIQPELLNSPEAIKYIPQLKQVVNRRLEETKGTLWGFKDPRVSALVPIWRKVFSGLDVVPKYILSVREPAAVVTSMLRQNENGPDVAELAWLYRNCEALYQTGGNCFISHYETWFGDDAQGHYENLVSFIGVEKGVESEGLKSVKKNLNRSAYADYQVKNRYVKKLYDKLKACHGDDFDRAALLEVVTECRSVLMEFAGWSGLANKTIACSGRRKELVVKYNNELMSLIDLQQEVDRLRAIESFQSENMRLHLSTALRLGNLLIDAVRKPGKNTLLLPFRLFKLVFVEGIIRRIA